MLFLLEYGILKSKDCILFISKPQTLSKRPGSLHSKCVSPERSYSEVHLLAQEWRSAPSSLDKGRADEVLTDPYG